jgi:hypothetical protein
MSMFGEKQLTLKPQDLLLALKVAVNRGREFTLVELGSELNMAISVVHGSIRRNEQARLISRSAGTIRVVRSALKEFAVHGAKYAFPAILGPLSKGVPTAIAGPVLRMNFEQADSLPPVWPDPTGSGYGPSVTPLYPTAIAACKIDDRLYEVLTLLDALRVGSAREQELAVNQLEERLT